MTSHETLFRVRYAETDQMGVVYYANYLVWMEVGRAEYCRASGIPYKDMELDGIRLAVVDAHCRYLYPARYDEEIAVTTSIAQSNHRLMVFDYQIRNAETGQMLANGHTKHIYLGHDMRPKKLPEKYYAAFGVARGVSSATGRT